MNQRDEMLDSIAKAREEEYPVAFGFVEGFEYMFLEELAKMEVPVAIFTKNGIKLTGTIIYYSDTALGLRGDSDGTVRLDAISSVTTIARGTRITVFTDGEEGLSMEVSTSGPRKWDPK